MRIHRLFLIVLAACGGTPTAVQVELSPSLISSLDGTTTIEAFVHDDASPLDDIAVQASVTYTDRNGTAHDIAPIDGRTDDRGVFRGTITGLLFDGTGTVTVDAEGISGTATFGVLDRTPPVVEILPPTSDLRVGPGLPLDILIHVTDEIGVSQVSFTANFQGSRTTIVASGALDTTQTFRTTIPSNAPTGPTIDLNALAGDLSGNLAVADLVTLTVDPTITITTPPDLQGSLLVEGTANTTLVAPRSIVFSSQDNHLYVADAANTGACSPSCIWRVNAATGAIDPTPVIVGIDTIEGIAVDATATQLLFSDRQNRIRRLTWNGTAYANPELCVDPQQQVPQDPLHLVVDATLGMLIADRNNREVVRVATCSTATVGTAFSTNGDFNEAQGIALGVAGDLYVSSDNSVSRVDLATGAATLFQVGITGAYGLEWLAGTSAYANTLLVATLDQRVVIAANGTTTVGVAFLRNPPIDVVVVAGTMYILTVPSNGNRGRIYRVTGF